MPDVKLSIYQQVKRASFEMSKGRELSDCAEMAAATEENRKSAVGEPYEEVAGGRGRHRAHMVRAADP